jgi:hypothetical protein
MARISVQRGFPMKSSRLAAGLMALGFLWCDTALPADQGSTTCRLMASVLDPKHSGKYTFKAELMGYARLLKSKMEFCTATRGSNRQPSVRLSYEAFDDVLTARENVTSGERQYGDHRPGSIDNVSGQTVYWKGGGRGPITLSFLINNVFVIIFAAPVDQYAGRDAILAHQPYVRDQLRRLAAAVVREQKSGGHD